MNGNVDSRKCDFNGEKTYSGYLEQQQKNTEILE